MEVIERYPLALRFAEGRGAWKALWPLRLMMAGFYGLGAWAAGSAARASGGRPVSRRAGSRTPIVVSVGNLEAGGGGKTPCVLALAAAIRSRGGVPVVLSRGYGGEAEGRGPFVIGGAAEPGDDVPRATAAQAASRSNEELAARFGDEIMLYHARGISAVVDARRRRGAELAVDLFAPTHLILDDGFQHHSLAKNLDILLLDAERPFGNGLLLPAGRLREGPAAARRAGAVIFTRATEERVPDAAAPYVSGTPVFFARHEPVGFIGLGGGRGPLSLVSGRDAIVFSGIARPAPFENLVSSLGASVRAAHRFADHHRYRAAEIESILRTGREGTLFVTTEKDFVKAAAHFPSGTALYALEIAMKVSGLERLLGLVAGGA